LGEGVFSWFQSARQQMSMGDCFMNIRTARKVEEELNYLPDNPVKRGLAKEPGDWP